MYNYMSNIFLYIYFRMNTIEETYKKLTDRQHVLLRPGTYIGSITNTTDNIYVLNNDTHKFEIHELTYNPAFQKLFDEILSNSIDEYKRNHKITTIEVTCNDKTISVKDDGGIPIEFHKTENVYIPELIFTNLRAGSNFNDGESRTVIGTNGLGASLTNIFSKEFNVETADGKSIFKQTCLNNMQTICNAVISKKKNKGYTIITYTPDVERFGMHCIDVDNVSMIQKRCIDAAATNPGLKIIYNNTTYQFKSFADYIKMHPIDDDVLFIESPNNDWTIGFGISNDGFQHCSFVNSEYTKDGGNHEEYILNQLINELRTKIKKKYKIDAKPNEIKNHLFLFINCTIINPAFNSQTKEKLITEIKNFGTSCVLSQKIINSVFKSEIIQHLIDWVQQKQIADEKAELRKINKSSINVTHIPKLIDAKCSNKNDRLNCELFITEGLSASASFRKFRNASKQGCFLLRGKILNVADEPIKNIIKNEELIQLMQSIGLSIGDTTINKNNLRYGKIYINTDADADGDAIAALLINFFYMFFPQLFEYNMIYRVNTPIVTVYNKKDKKKEHPINFYNQSDYDAWDEEHTNIGDISKYSINYKKGLAALEDNESKMMIQQTNLTQITIDDVSKESLQIWFSKDTVDKRKDLLLDSGC